LGGIGLASRNIKWRKTADLAEIGQPAVRPPVGLWRIIKRSLRSERDQKQRRGRQPQGEENTGNFSDQARLGRAYAGARGVYDANTGFKSKTN
jgi:hypothetical protein